MPNASVISRWALGALAASILGLGGLATARPTAAAPAQAAGHRVFELRIYHAVAGKLPVMEARFRDTTSKLLEKHHLTVLGYWTAEDTGGSDSRFVFLLGHESAEDAKKNWAALREDPEFQQVTKAEQGEKTLEKAEILSMNPTDFSPMN